MLLFAAGDPEPKSVPLSLVARLEEIAADIQLARHGTGSHFAYADGHIAVVQEEAIVDWVDRGFDFARPQ